MKGFEINVGKPQLWAPVDFSPTVPSHRLFAVSFFWNALPHPSPCPNIHPPTDTGAAPSQLSVTSLKVTCSLKLSGSSFSSHESRTHILEPLPLICNDFVYLLVL